METYHIYGAVFLAYIVIKEVFVLVKGDTKKTHEMVSHIHDIVTKREDSLMEANNTLNTALRELRSLCDYVERTNEYVGDLHTWHDKEDYDGVKVWYVRKSLTDSIKKVADLLSAEAQALSVVIDKLDRLIEVYKQDSSDRS